MDPVLETLAASLQCSPEERKPIVVMTCGMAGSGKTTLVKAIRAAHPAFHRLSIDQMIHEKHGIYGVDYEASTKIYEQYLAEADENYMSTFRTLLSEKQDIIIEKSFYAKEDRDEYRNLATEGGAKVILVFLKAEGDYGKMLLWERICKRSKAMKTADNAFDITRETFEKYWSGFENPTGEGEIVVKVE